MMPIPCAAVEEQASSRERTVGSTRTASPTATASAAAVPKTKSPSEVAKLLSAAGSSKKNPFETFAVTMPGTLETA